MNNSGMVPLDLRVLVRPDPVEERTAGGIILTAETLDKKKWETCKATLVACGSNAWSEAKATRGFDAPQPGARVMISKYAGILTKGDDGEEYRLINDEDVVAVLVEN